MNLTDVASRLREKLADAVVGEVDFRGEKTLSVKPESIKAVARFCRDELGFDYLVDIASLDHFGEFPRYEMVYELYSMKDGLHLRLKSLIQEEDEPMIDTVADLWPTANWHEREVYDMMGIRFEGHPDMRRILMWEGYPFYPLRKDFPLEGKPSDISEVATTYIAPLEGGPFVTVPSSGTSQVREPRAKRVGDVPPEERFIAEP
ncbi:hypothetical protein BH09VER1_BH09VER1_15850 [soil metagenome]